MNNNIKCMVCLLLLLLGVTAHTDAQTTWAHDGTYYNGTGTITISVPSLITRVGVSGPWSSPSSEFDAEVTLDGQTVSITEGNSDWSDNANDPCVFLHGRSRDAAIKLDPGTYTWTAKVKLRYYGHTCYGIRGFQPGVSFSTKACANLAPDDHYFRATSDGTNWNYAKVTGNDPRIYVHQNNTVNKVYAKTGNNDAYLGSHSYTGNVAPRIQQLNTATCTWENTPFTSWIGNGKYYCESKRGPGGYTAVCSNCKNKTVFNNVGNTMVVLGTGGAIFNPGIGGGLAVGGAILLTGTAAFCDDLPPATQFRTNQGGLSANDFGDLSAQLYPNPTSGQSTLTLTLPEADELTAEVYTLQGQVVKTVLFGEAMPAGRLDLPVDLTDLAPGQYILRVSSAKGLQLSKQLIKE